MSNCILGVHMAAPTDMASYLHVLAEFQREAAAFAVPDLLLSDELIADRHLEARRETAEANEWLAERTRSEKGPFVANPCP
jgi:hypothetical protein